MLFSIEYQHVEIERRGDTGEENEQAILRGTGAGCAVLGWRVLPLDAILDIESRNLYNCVNRGKSMRKIKQVSLSEYITEALRNAIYEKDNSLGKISCVVAEAPDLPGCYTQAENFEEARRNLIEAIELWMTVALRNNENLPVINNSTLLKPTRKLRSQKEKVFV